MWQKKKRDIHHVIQQLILLDIVLKIRNYLLWTSYKDAV